MVGNNHNSPGLGNLLGRIGRTAITAFNVRVELLTVELQEERLRLRNLLIWAVVLLFFGMMGAMLLTATVIFLFPPETRVYVAGVIAILYLCGAVGAWFGLRAGLKREPFAESIEQVKKDRLWLESLK